jgi:NAD(P)-dependent dehydrogenase (short-subunit alcohol dehydrogenase family)
MSRDTGTVLLVGASRGLGLGLAREYLGRGWHVVATARDPARAKDLAALADAHKGKLRVEKLDVTKPADAAALAKTLGGTKLDVLFVVAGQASHGAAPVHEATPEQAATEFVTNSFAPPVVAEALLPLLKPDGTVVFMTSRLGSLALTQGGMELYNASKAALNMLGINFAQRHAKHRVLLMHPGWVKTDMGGSNAPLEIEESVRGMVDTIEKRAKGHGVAYVDYANAELPW